MKYIRTKDGIYEVIEECFKPMENNMVFTPREGLTKILSQADSIEELCDGFVMKTYLTYYTNSHLKDLLLEYDKFHIKDGIAIYGAIFTDEGFIYKAKIKGILPNGEIDWELL